MSRRSPSRRIASTCAGRPTRTTRWPARASIAPKKLPTAPAPTTATFANVFTMPVFWASRHSGATQHDRVPRRWREHRLHPVFAARDVDERRRRDLFGPLARVGGVRVGMAQLERDLWHEGTETVER